MAFADIISLGAGTVYFLVILVILYGIYKVLTATKG